MILLQISTHVLSQCSEKNEYCLGCWTSANTCSYCADSFLSESSVCLPVETSINFCFSYQSEGKCIECQYGYYLDDSKCTKIPVSGCVEFDKDTMKCLSCQNNINVDSKDLCEEGSECEILHCKYCKVVGAKTQCIHCQDGYAVINSNGVGSCIQETKSIENCKSVDEVNNLKCKICDSPYYNMSGSCLKSTLYSLTKFELKDSVILFLFFNWILFQA